jgi:chromosome segregation protein
LVYIKKLEIFGFKSFGFKNTVLQFNNGLVAITGPNGSGKSNILDAIIFVLGENSPKILRVDRFQSLFHDTQNSTNRLIRVKITFDNIDRGIPVDTDSVSMTREMEGQSGESQYYLNGKKVSKNTILELLEIVVAAPNKLNVVQQGMITRISELNSEERRKLIEDIVGLSYFDDKKTEALNQLEESDRRLEVALARMGEIRKRIGELEVERNDQLRYAFIETEVKKFKALKYSNKLRNLRSELETRTKILEENNKQLDNFSTEIKSVQESINDLQNEKTNFIQEVDKANKAKAQVDRKISNIFQELEREKAVLNVSQGRLKTCQDKLPNLQSEEVQNKIRFQQAKERYDKEKGNVHNFQEDLQELKEHLLEINLDIEKLNEYVSRIELQYESIESRESKLTCVQNNLEIVRYKFEEKLKIHNQSLGQQLSKIMKLKRDLSHFELNYQDLDLKIKSTMDEYENENNSLAKMKSTGDHEGSKLSYCSDILNKAMNIGKKYETRFSILEDINNEDFAIAHLIKFPVNHGIVGMVENLIEWDAAYTKSIYVSAADWLKACVVKDVNRMIELASYIKENDLPRFKIIPLSAFKYVKKVIFPRPSLDVLGNLADFVQSSIAGLPIFLFGNILLVRDCVTALELSKQGYRTVTLGGQLFEPYASSLLLDFRVKIPDFTRDIILNGPIKSIINSSQDLNNQLSKRLQESTELSSAINKKESKLTFLNGKLAEATLNFDHFKNLIKDSSFEIEKIEPEISMLEVLIQNIKDILLVVNKRLEIISKSKLIYAEKKRSLDSNRDAKSQLAKLGITKLETLKAIEQSEIKLREMITSLTSTENEMNISMDVESELKSEIHNLSNEHEVLIQQIESRRTTVNILEKNLVDLRNEEQKTINTSGESYSILQVYEDKLKIFSSKERELSKQFNSLDKDSVIIKKDINSLSSQEVQTQNDLMWIGYKDLVDYEDFDVDGIISELESEKEVIKQGLNLKAEDNYFQVAEGYRSMSTRKNDLETERNSIVLFIEEIIKEKKSVFMEAFNKVDEDIRKTFSDVTGGSAYLEIENTDDIFSGGLSYLVSFPGKPPRESTALSGGEKTMAATIFLLAIQCLKPSPFYLMDEVDAHLDAQNTERLSKILFERGKGNQILMVTLKDSTVAKADQIFGVYPKSGISQVIFYKNPKHVPLAQVTVE